MRVAKIQAFGIVGLIMFALASHADGPADALLKEVARATNATQTLSAKLTLSEQIGASTPQDSSGTVELMKPNLARVELDDQQIISDGRKLWTLLTAKNEYLKRTMDAHGSNISVQWAFPVQLFFNPDVTVLGGTRYTKTTALTGTETVAGQNYDTVTVTAIDTERREPTQTLKIYVGADRLIHQTTLQEEREGQVTIWSASLEDMKPGVAINPNDFRFTLPLGARLSISTFTGQLVPVGEKAPDFTLATPNGGRVSLQSVYPTKKAVLVNFWFCSCPGCRAEVPHLQKIYDAYKAQGLEIIAINRGDTSPAIRNFLNGFQLSYGVGKGTAQVFRDYGVHLYPSNFLLDNKGNVVFRSAGFNERGLRLALKDMGFN